MKDVETQLFVRKMPSVKYGFKKFACGGLLGWGRAYLIEYNYIFYIQEVLFVIINFLYTRVPNSGNKKRALKRQSFSVADGLTITYFRLP